MFSLFKINERSNWMLFSMHHQGRIIDRYGCKMLCVLMLLTNSLCEFYKQEQILTQYTINAVTFKDSNAVEKLAFSIFITNK